jgi:hypothetical protein
MIATGAAVMLVTTACADAELVVAVWASAGIASAQITRTEEMNFMRQLLRHDRFQIKRGFYATSL